MRKTLARIGLIGLAVLLAGTVAAVPSSKGSTDTAAAAPPGKTPSEVYQAECGSCHLAYPPALLPAASWQRLLGGLDDHFGENAELDPEMRAKLEGWLVEHAAESAGSKRGRKILRSLGGQVPLRISQTPYILRKHEDVRSSVFARPSVGSRAHCNACHAGAERGDFDDDRARIPK
jgi:cytochrome c5